MSKITKIIGIFIILLILWVGLLYSSIAFIEVKANPLTWSGDEKIFFTTWIWTYFLLSPLLFTGLNDYFNRKKKF